MIIQKVVDFGRRSLDFWVA